VESDTYKGDGGGGGGEEAPADGQQETAETGADGEAVPE